MRKVQFLSELLKKIKEQDDALSLATAPDVIGSDDIVGGDELDISSVPTSYGQEFFKNLKEGDEFSDNDDPSIRYRVLSDPEMDEEGMVTSLPCEVTEAPEENTKGVAVGDTFDAISEMPGSSDSSMDIGEPLESKVDNPGTPPIVPDHSPVPKEKVPPEEPAKGRQIPANKKRSNDQIPGLTRPPKTVPEGWEKVKPAELKCKNCGWEGTEDELSFAKVSGKSDTPVCPDCKNASFEYTESVPAVTTQVRKTRKFNSPGDPEKGQQVSGEGLRRRKEGFTLRKRFGEAASAKGVVQQITKDRDGKDIAIVRIGNSRYHLEVPPSSGAGIGDEVEVEDMNKITKVITKVVKK